MTKAKHLYVKQKFDWTRSSQMKSLDDLRAALTGKREYAERAGVLTEVKGERYAEAAEAWASVPGLRHKYFVWNKATQTCGGVFVFYDDASLQRYLESDLHNTQRTLPHVAKDEVWAGDVVPGTELSVEKHPWPTSPPMRKHLTMGKMLVVDIHLNYETGNPPRSAEDLYGMMAAPPAGQGYLVSAVSELRGLRGVYFAYYEKTEHLRGFYTFLDKASLDAYLQSELFESQAEAPHVMDMHHSVHDILPGSELTVDLGVWTGE
jgi:hypothetical protein